jgi:hypothetical protein
MRLPNVDEVYRTRCDQIEIRIENVHLQCDWNRAVLRTNLCSYLSRIPLIVSKACMQNCTCTVYNPYMWKQ